MISCSQFFLLFYLSFSNSFYSGFTPSISSGNDDVWRPGGALDNSNEDDNDNWGSSSNTDSAKKQDPFSNTTADTGGGWGNDQQEATWTPSTTEDQQKNEIPISSTSEKKENNGFKYGAGISTATMGAADGEEAPVWFMERVCVQLNKNNATAVIKETNNNVAVVELEDKTIETINASECTMVEPKEHDTVLVTGGADVGVEGELICIDDSDAIIKDSNEEFKIVDVVHLAKIKDV